MQTELDNHPVIKPPWFPLTEAEHNLIAFNIRGKKMEQDINTQMTKAQDTLEALAIMDEKNIVHVQTADEIGTEESPSTVPLQ